MLIWRGWGVLAFAYVALAMILFLGVGSMILPESGLPFSAAIGLALAAVATWFTGNAMNRTSPGGKIRLWEAERRLQLAELVESGGFSLGPGQPQPRSMDEAQEMADALFEHERAQTKGAFDQHTLFWIPMQYSAFLFAALAVVCVIVGFVA